MVSKVCPVCNMFSTLSINTLNVHIDMCLSMESMDVREPKTSSCLVINFKRKPRNLRMTRLLVDIYATTESCTIEDIEKRNGGQWIGSSTPPSENLDLEASPSRLTEFQAESGPSSEPDQNLGSMRKKKPVKRKHAAEFEEDSLDDDDILLSTIRKMSSKGKRRKLIITDWESDDDDDTNRSLLDLPISQVTGSLMDLLETKFSNLLIGTKPPPKEKVINSELSNGNEQSDQGLASNSVLRLMGRNLIVNRPQLQVSGSSTRQFLNTPTERLELPATYNHRATQQTPNMRFYTGGLFRAPNIQQIQPPPIYPMRNDNRIMAGAQNIIVGSESGYLYGGGGRCWNRVNQMRDPRFHVPMTAPTMEMNNYFCYNNYQALPPPVAFPYSHFHVPPQMETTVANINPRARFNGFTPRGASSSLPLPRYIPFPGHQGPRFNY